MKRTFFIFDTIGIALFTISGMQKGLMFDLHPSLAMVMGLVSATVGGVIRDILCNEIPVIFRKEIYATACILGGALYFILKSSGVVEEYAYVSAILLVILLRILAVRFGISLPSIYSRGTD